MKHVTWPLSGFEEVPSLITWSDATHRAATTKYPIRYLRYWFARSALIQHRRSIGRPLRVLEVGVDRGDMLCFAGGSPRSNGTRALPDWIAEWDGFDVQFDPAVLKRFSYSRAITADIEAGDQSWHDGKPYDAIVLLHVLEHLSAPEAAMKGLLGVLAPGGVIIGGSPTMPAAFGWVHEPYLRRKYADRMHDVRIHKHLSVISPVRLRRFARRNGLTKQLVAGAFLIRASGNPLENFPLWIRANLLWGALFPSLGGEVYFCFEKPAR